MPNSTVLASFEVCPDCRCKLPLVDTARHNYLGASASCWSLYNLILAREYSSPALMKSVHRLTVDAYAAQHPGTKERRTTQSIWVHLVALHLVLDRGLSTDFATRAIGALTTKSDALTWLEPPHSLGRITVAHIAEAVAEGEHTEAVRQWALDVWSAWKSQHAAVRSMAARVI
jgi:hypothetical protein